MTFEELTKGLPIVDATAAVTIKIRRHDIDGAQDRNPEHCVVARGMKRVGGATAVKIGARIALTFKTGDAYVLRYTLATETRNMIKAYDGSGFYPSGVSATLMPPSVSERLGYVKKGSSGQHTGTGIKQMGRPWLRHINQPVGA